MSEKNASNQAATILRSLTSISPLFILKNKGAVVLSLGLKQLMQHTIC